jgi:hypothetical protein
MKLGFTGLGNMGSASMNGTDAELTYLNAGDVSANVFKCSMSHLPAGPGGVEVW